MEYIIAVIAVVVMTFVAGSLLDKLHPACSSLDFPSNDAYFAHLEKRDRYFQEEHVGLAALNTIIAVGAASLFFGTASAVMLPTVAFALTVFATWCVLRFCIRRPDQMFRWDRVDMTFLGIALVLGIVAGVAVAVALSLSLFGLWSVAIFIVAWLLLFPL